MSGQRVGIVGDERLVGPVEAAGGEAIVRNSDDIGPVSVVVADGEGALADLVRAPIDAPVLPVAVENGFRSVPFDAVEVALERVLRGDSPTERHPIVAATGPFGPIRAAFDIALMAAEPARISEFAVHSGDDRISRFRADGVVVSTPAGSHGYNRYAGGPVVASGLDVVSIVPIAPFATAAEHWVLPVDAVTLSVERDETPVELLVDGRRERIVDPGDRITISRVGHLETYVVPELDGAL